MSAKLKKSRRRGQALLEYILLIAGLSVASFAFLKLFSSQLFGVGMGRLPSRVSVCASHLPAGNRCDPKGGQ